MLSCNSNHTVLSSYCTLKVPSSLLITQYFSYNLHERRQLIIRIHGAQLGLKKKTILLRKVNSTLNFLDHFCHHDYSAALPVAFSGRQQAFFTPLAAYSLEYSAVTIETITSSHDTAAGRLRPSTLPFHCLPIMSVDQPFNIYREQLSSQYHGLALWDPKPVENLHKQPGHVSIGDVGYLDNGAFMRMFNVTLPWDDPSNNLLGKPEKYEHIKPGHLGGIRDNEIREGEYCTLRVSKVDNVGANRHEE